MQKLLKLIKDDIETTRETISEYIEYYDNTIQQVDNLIDDVMNWDGKDVGVSFEVGYLRALEVLKGEIEKEMNK
jgi:nucleoside 2-deoxyribosyltransferase